MVKIELFALLWMAGIAAGCWRMLGGFKKGDGMYFGLCIFVALFFLMPGKHVNLSEYSPFAHLPGSFGAFIVFFAYLFRQRIAALIDERVILVWTLLTLYVGVEVIGTANPAFYVLAYVAVLVLVLAACPWSLPRRLRIAMYIWFMFCVSMIGVLQVRSSAFKPFLGVMPSSWYSYPEAFMTGMALLMTGSYVCHLLSLVPLPGKHQTFSQRWKEVRANALFFSTRYKTTQADVWWHTAMIIVFGALLIANYLWRAVPAFLLTNTIIVFLPFIIPHAPVHKKSR